MAFAEDCVGDVAAEAVATLGDGDVLLLENLRFHAGEEANDPQFARRWPRNADAYVNDAFGAAHRAHASTEGVAQLLPCRRRLPRWSARSRRCPRCSRRRERPFVAVVGGAKVTDKIGVIERLTEVADEILIGGAMAYTFSLANGGAVGDSLHEADEARDRPPRAAAGGGARCELRLPEDTVAADAFEADARTQVVGDRRGAGRVDGPRHRPGPRRGLRGARRGARAPCCGTARWACSSWRRSRPARRRWREAVADVPARPWSAAATRSRRSRSSGSPTGSRTCRPAAAQVLELLEGKQLPGVAAIPLVG